MLPSIPPSKKNLSSFSNFPSITLKREDVISFGSISAKKPKLPKLIPKIGIPFDPNFLEQLSIVPSPPIAISRFAFEIMFSLEETERSFDFSFERFLSISILIPIFDNTSLH